MKISWKSQFFINKMKWLEFLFFSIALSSLIYWNCRLLKNLKKHFQDFVVYVLFPAEVKQEVDRKTFKCDNYHFFLLQSFFFGRVLNKEIKNGDYYSIFTHVKR